MIKKKYFIWYLSGVFILIILLVFQGRKSKKEITKNGGFTRTYLNHSYKLVESKKLSNGLLKPSGYTKNGLYISHNAAKNILLLNFDSESLSVSYPENALFTSNKENQFYFLNDSLYVFNNEDFVVRKYGLSSQFKLIDSIKLAGRVIQPKILTSGAILYKSFIPKTNKIGIFLSNYNEPIINNFDLFPNGITMADDGIIQPYNNGYAYICMYFNMVKLLDKDLKVKGTYKTIDTVSTSPGVVTLSSGNIVYRAQPTFVNRATFLISNKLYVYSGIFADNDRKVSSFNTFILDVYDLTEDFRYLHSLSFPLPPENESISSSFLFYEDEMYLFQVDGRVIKYKLT